MTVLIATKNRNKQREIKKILAKNKHKIVYADDVNLTKDVDEIGDTFAENARIKAKAAADFTGLVAAGDDSGLSVNVLNGEPGVNSRRWQPGSDQDRCQALLKKMHGHNDRSAVFTTVICLYNPKSTQEIYFSGEIVGTITKKPQGNGGFGYDSIFVPEGMKRTFAELAISEKNRLSGRGRAFHKLYEYLESQSL
ncbi:MAG: non-canonical purine NTP pyrophosphatase, RdgB/HAM1 family [Candidatus Pacebacteria bacterium CG_4_10_14_0_8_um_filter_42_14]|nr:MAG: non-canonical purine NTP pyrophosphatase, RdgB/HAM1 family [Candidatus Pacebacteria bacterium CG_4_10_14_0_8_um_filter_42_14]